MPTAARRQLGRGEEAMALPNGTCGSPPAAPILPVPIASVRVQEGGLQPPCRRKDGNNSKKKREIGKIFIDYT